MKLKSLEYVTAWPPFSKVFIILIYIRMKYLAMGTIALSQPHCFFFIFFPSSCRHGRDVSLKISVGFGMNALIGKAIPQLLLAGSFLSFFMYLLVLGLKVWSFSTIALLNLYGIPQPGNVASDIPPDAAMESHTHAKPPWWKGQFGREFSWRHGF